MSIEIPCSCGYINRRSTIPKNLKCGGCHRSVRVHIDKKTFDRQKAARASNKYGAKKCRCRQGYLHHSRAEAHICNQLHLELMAGIYSRIRHEPQYPLMDGDKPLGLNHYPDFGLYYPDGRKAVLEVKSKGTVTALWKLKKALFKSNYPEIEYLMKWV